MSLKKLVYTAFVAFWACVFTIVMLDSLSGNDSGHPPPHAHSLATYTLAEVARHDTLDDCWMAIDGKVYDFTGYIDHHPTEPSVLEPWCGSEATEGMKTKGYGRNHSQRAWRAMEDYLIGELSEE